MTKPPSKKKIIVYISSLGMLEPLGESQVLQYLKYLSKDFQLALISFEKTLDWQNEKHRNEIQRKTDQANILWIPNRYRYGLGPVSGILNILQGLLSVWRIAREHEIRFIHARSYYPAVVALALKWMTNTPFIFDMRGFWADEKIDSGRWKSSSMRYKLWKKVEQAFITHSCEIISLSYAGIEEMKKFDYVNSKITEKFSMIPTCADLDTFTPKNQSNERGSIVVGYVGSTKNWYDFDAALKFIQAMKKKRPETKVLIINKGEHSYIRKMLTEFNIDLKDITLTTATFSEMPEKIRQMDVCVFFIKKLYSKKASNPTKLGELLGCGVPCVTGSDIGDVDEIVRDNKVGVVLNSMSEMSITQGLDELFTLLEDSETPRRCRQTAEEYYSVSMGVQRYAKIYAKYY